MGYTVKNNTKVAVMKEATPGEYQAPASGADFIQVLADGLEVTPSREVLERNVLGTGLGKVAPRAGLKSVSGSIPVEMKSGSTPGSAPEYGIMLESLMGAKRSSTSVTSGTGNTASLIKTTNTANFKKGDCITIKEAGAYHTSPIKEIVDGVSIELLIPMASAPSDNVVVEAFTTYVCAENGHASLSVAKYVENAVLETARGCKATSMSLDNFSTAQIASFNFGFEGLDFGRALSAPAYTPVFDTSETPTIVKACLYQNGNEIFVNDFSFSIENTLGFIQDTCNGKSSSRITGRSVSGSFNPYKQDDSIENFNTFDKNLPFNLFVSARNPLATEGEFHQSVSFYFPHCKITELGEADADGVLQDTISFSGNTEDGSLSEVFITVC
jgi:hypothetical protein